MFQFFLCEYLFNLEQITCNNLIHNLFDAISFGQARIGCTVYIRKPDRPALQWPSLGHFLCLGFEWLA
jgi:hypothetical protein